MSQQYAAGKQLHGIITVSTDGFDQEFLWYDNDGFIYTPQNGDRLILDELTVSCDVNGFPDEPVAVYFDYTNQGSLTSISEIVHISNPSAGQTIVFPNGNSRAGKRLMNGIVALRVQCPSGGSGPYYFNANARVVQT